MIEADLNAVKCFLHHANKPIPDIPIITAVTKDIHKIMETQDWNRLGFEPEHVQCLIHTAITENGPDNFVGLWQAALNSVMFWGSACFEKVKDLEICQI